MDYCAGKHIENWGYLNTTLNKPHFQWIYRRNEHTWKVNWDKRKDCKSPTEGNWFKSFSSALPMFLVSLLTLTRSIALITKIITMFNVSLRSQILTQQTVNNESLYKIWINKVGNKTQATQCEYPFTVWITRKWWNALQENTAAQKIVQPHKYMNKMYQDIICLLYTSPSPRDA